MRSATLVWTVLLAALVVLACACGSRGGNGSGTGSHTPAISIIPASLPNGMVSFPYSQSINAVDGAAPITWTISSGSLPRNVTMANSSTGSVILSGTPDAAQSATFTIQAKDAINRVGVQSYTIKITAVGKAGMQSTGAQVPAGIIEIRGLSAGPFNPLSWQQNTLNWVPDVRLPMLAPLATSAWQNIYAPWALEQPTGWRMFYGGWDGTPTPNDRVYSIDTPDFLTFTDRIMVIDHGDFLHVNNENITQLSDGSMHMICTIAVDETSNGKPAYFASPDGITWNGTSEPYSARLTDVVSIPNDSNYPGWDFNGGNVLLWDANTWALYYSVGIYGGIGQVYRATSTLPPIFQKTGVALDTLNYINDVKKFSVGGKTWYLASLYVERATFDPSAPTLTYSLSNDGVTFGPEQILFSGATATDKFLMTPSFVTRNGSILGVLYGANATDLLDPNQIFARWLQKQLVITNTTGPRTTPLGAHGPDRQWLQAPSSGAITGSIAVYAEDGVTPLGRGQVSLAGGKSYILVLN